MQLRLEWAKTSAIRNEAGSKSGELPVTGDIQSEIRYAPTGAGEGFRTVVLKVWSSDEPQQHAQGT